MRLRRFVNDDGEFMDVEVMDEETAGSRKSRKQVPLENWKGRWMISFLDTLEEIVSDFSGEEARVFLHLFATVGWNNEWNLLNQRIIGERMQMHQPQVSRVLASLTKRQVIVKGARVGSSHAYRFNPELGWRGHKTDYAAARKNTPDVIRVHQAVTV
jgi:hypothetical protein